MWLTERSGDAMRGVEGQEEKSWYIKIYDGSSGDLVAQLDLCWLIAGVVVDDGEDVMAH